MIAIKEMRKNKGLTLSDVAKSMNVQKGYLSQIENGKRTVSKNRAVELSYIFNAEVEDIFIPTRFKAK